MPVTVKLRGLEEMRMKVATLKSDIAEKGLNSAQNAAARVVKYAAQAAAPSGETGVLGRSISIFRKRTRELTIAAGQHDIPVVRVGPSQKGYYGYFLEHGWKATGPHRRKRIASGNTHSQSGTSKARQVRGKHWFERGINRVEEAAQRAGEKALDQTIRRLAR